MQMDPIALRIFGLSIHWYAVFIVGGATLGLFLASLESKRVGENPEFISDFALMGLPISVIGARLYYVLFDLPYYLASPSRILRIWEGGLAIYGGIIAGFIFVWYFAKKKKISVWKFLDILGPSVLLAQAIGRWGNFINQEAHGGPTTRAFLSDTLHLPNFIVNNMNINGVYYHPTFLYESAWTIIGCLALFLLRRKAHLFRQGQVFFTGIAWYSFARFFIEGMRTDSLMLTSTIRVSQLLSMILFIGSLYMILRLKKNPYYEE